jgi:molybdopterin/thiamine biosynthesis adenylyltransferase
VGVLGVVPGQIGLVQAAEVLKLILGIGNSLKGRLLVYDALDVEFRVFNFHKNKACPLCGDKPTITGVGVGASGEQQPAVYSV